MLFENRHLRPQPNAPFGRVMVAKTTHLGDLVISLPLASAIKRRDPGCTVVYLTNRATADVARHCRDIDEVYGLPETTDELVALLAALKIDIFVQVNVAHWLAKAAFDAGIPIRIGTMFRYYNYRFCTHLVANSRSYAGMNKRQLDLQYLRPLGICATDWPEVLALSRCARPVVETTCSTLRPRQFANQRHTIVISASLVTARGHQWPLEAYSELIRSFDPDKFHWFVCGISSERDSLTPLLAAHQNDSNVTDLVGKLSLTDFMAFIGECDGLIAGSTGPVHLAAAMGIHTLGLYSSSRSDIRRWAPVGPRASVIYSNQRCTGISGARGANAMACPCIVAITPERVAQRVQSWFQKP
ncbi:MAG: glycosyltransferase family 9 protein [Bdellovibrionales bacterium]|nr:glycosyltransferase family 9 protein [Massilia sp.]